MQKNQPTPQTINQYIIEAARKNNPGTVEQLTKLVQQKYPLSETEIIEHILHLQNQRKLASKEHAAPHPSRLGGYLLSPNSTPYWTIIALAIATTTLATAAIIREHQPKQKRQPSSKHSL